MLQAAPVLEALCVKPIMFSAIKIINSKNKKDLRFVAAGSYQIEFFENEGSNYFAIYRFNYVSEGQAQYYLLDLGRSSIAQVSKMEFQIVEGASTYKLRIKESKVYVTRYLWGWLPLSRLGGKVSQAGLALLISSFEVYENDLAA